jgi:integrase
MGFRALRWRLASPRAGFDVVHGSLLRKLKRDEIESRFVFMTERAAPITPAWISKMFVRTGESAKFPFPVHPHMLRHACGYKLAARTLWGTEQAAHSTLRRAA